MKTMLMVTITWLAFAACMAQEPRSYTKDFRDALRHGAEVKMTLKVIDESGEPVSNALCNVGFYNVAATDDDGRGLSDSNGLFVVSGKGKGSIGGTVSKTGFYTSCVQFKKGDPPGLIDAGGGSSKAYYDSIVKDGRWLPWNPTVPVVLREIRNPIPMYVKRVHGKFPNGETAGFDCKKGDFVAPYGSGENEDFRVALFVDGVPYKHMTQTISLSALDSGGGFRAMKSHAASVFKSEHLAPEQGYASNLVATSVYDVNIGTTGSVLYGGDEYLVFKSRIVRDEDGNVISANYGKLYGPIIFGRGDDKMETASIGFLYYFNPTPNDRNLEFDGKNNLFKPGWNSKLNWSQEP
jgi:hypothetical protein